MNKATEVTITYPHHNGLEAVVLIGVLLALSLVMVAIILLIIQMIRNPL